MAKRAEPIIRRKLIEALQNKDNARTQKESARHLGEAYAYANSLEVMGKVEGYVPVGGIVASIHNSDSMVNNLDRVQQFMGEQTREILGLDHPDEVA